MPYTKDQLKAYWQANKEILNQKRRQKRRLAKFGLATEEVSHSQEKVSHLAVSHNQTKVSQKTANPENFSQVSHSQLSLKTANPKLENGKTTLTITVLRVALPINIALIADTSPTTNSLITRSVKVNSPERETQKAKTKKATRKPIKAKTTALLSAKTKAKNTLAYYQCLCHQTQQGLKGKRITQACRDCKHNALAINAKMSAQKIQAVKKIKQGYETLGKGLGELLKASK
ncbi:2254_t:CDS:2 [Entrophospora sp. SA101]|nr:1605_t:CDS:2 [Entrophospora sp. SA101]CAJ0747341.1 2254_t:CDS:2 [Entrophospora sp. SA101]